MSILLSVVTEADPFVTGLVGDDQWAGPALCAINNLPCQRVLLFVPPGQICRAQETQQAILERHPSLQVEILELATGDGSDPGDLAASILKALPSELRHPGKENLLVSVGPGAPEVAVAWGQILASGELTAHLFLVHPNRGLASDTPSIQELPRPARYSHEPGQPLYVREPPASYQAIDDPGAATEVMDEQERIPATPQWQLIMHKLGIFGEEPAFLEAMRTVATLAEHNVPVLIQGETGTGKGLASQLIHHLSDRAQKPFVAINCGALPDKLVESVLFGHRKGAFTGASGNQAGKFEQAHTGTLFLDEIGEMPLDLQPKLLKVLEDQVVEPIGAPEGRKVDVRIIAATNRPLEQSMAEGSFREDLYYRLSFGLVHLPPLRERRGDIHRIALSMVDRLNLSLRTPKRLSPEALRRLETQPWPGNVRALENVIGRSMLLAEGDLVEAKDLALGPVDGTSGQDWPTPHEGFSLETWLRSARKQLMLKAVDMTNGNRAAAARLLGMTPQAVSRFMKQEDDQAAQI